MEGWLDEEPKVRTSRRVMQIIYTQTPSSRSVAFSSASREVAIPSLVQLQFAQRCRKSQAKAPRPTPIAAVTVAFRRCQNCSSKDQRNWSTAAENVGA